jgi:hypothetical protein
VAEGKQRGPSLDRRGVVLYWTVTVLFLLNWGRLIVASYYHWHSIPPDAHFALTCLLIVFPAPWLVMAFEKQIRLLALGCCSYIALGFSVSLVFWR